MSKKRSLFPNKNIHPHKVYKAVAGYHKATGNIITFDLKVSAHIGLYVVDASGRQQFIGRFPNWEAYAMINRLTAQAEREKIEQKNNVTPTPAVYQKRHIVPTPAVSYNLFLPPGK